MTKKDKACFAVLSALGEKATPEELTELAALQAIIDQEAADNVDPYEGCTSVVTMRDGKPQTVFFRDGKEVGAADVA